MLRFRVLLEAFLHECLFPPLSPSFSGTRAEAYGILLRAPSETASRLRRCSEALSRTKQPHAGASRLRDGPISGFEQCSPATLRFFSFVGEGPCGSRIPVHNGRT